MGENSKNIVSMFNINITREYQLNKKNSYKILHIIHHQILLVITNNVEGERAFIQLMSKVFLFTLNEEGARTSLTKAQLKKEDYQSNKSSWESEQEDVSSHQSGIYEQVVGQGKGQKMHK